MEMWAATGRTCGVGEAGHPVPRPLKAWLCLLDVKLSPPEQKRIGMTATQLWPSQPLLADRLVMRERLPFSRPLRCLRAPETAPFPLFPPHSALPPLCCFLSSLSAPPFSSNSPGGLLREQGSRTGRNGLRAKGWGGGVLAASGWALEEDISLSCCPRGTEHVGTMSRRVYGNTQSYLRNEGALCSHCAGTRPARTRPCLCRASCWTSGSISLSVSLKLMGSPWASATVLLLSLALSACDPLSSLLLSTLSLSCFLLLFDLYCCLSCSSPNQKSLKWGKPPGRMGGRSDALR